jgi:hypothetical protein
MSSGYEHEFERVNSKVPRLVMVDKARAFEVFDTLIDAHENKQPPYDTFVPPQEYRPDSLRPGGELYGTPEHAMFLWNACAYMSAADSAYSFQRLTELFKDRPELFDCERLRDVDTSELSGILQREGLPGRQNFVAGAWVENAKRLGDNFDGNPLKVFDGVENYDDCLNRVCNDGKGGGFRGFQAKMVSMILYYYQYDKLLPELPFPVPVDFHVQRIALSTEIVKPDVGAFHRQPKIEDAIRSLTLDYVHERGTDPLALTDVLWGLSSSFCSGQPGNAARSKKIGEHIHHVFAEINHENMKQSEAWHRTCGQCALSAFCLNDIPSAPYYRSGQFVIRPRPKGQYAKQLNIFDEPYAIPPPRQTAPS